MTDYAELRAALAAGPTPGPWGVQSSNSWRRIGTPRGDGDVLSPTLQADGHPDLSARPETLTYIAAANPEAIRALLAERDALREVAQAALAYDSAIQSCANNPDAMSSFCTAEGDDLDSLYADWISKARAALAQGES